MKRIDMATILLALNAFLSLAIVAQKMMAFENLVYKIYNIAKQMASTQLNCYSSNISSNWQSFNLHSYKLRINVEYSLNISLCSKNINQHMRTLTVNLFSKYNLNGVLKLLRESWALTECHLVYFHGLTECSSDCISAFVSQLIRLINLFDFFSFSVRSPVPFLKFLWFLFDRQFISYFFALLPRNDSWAMILNGSANKWYKQALLKVTQYKQFLRLCERMFFSFAFCFERNDA